MRRRPQAPKDRHVPSRPADSFVGHEDDCNVSRQALNTAGNNAQPDAPDAWSPGQRDELVETPLLQTQDVDPAYTRVVLEGQVSKKICTIRYFFSGLALGYRILISCGKCSP